MNRKRGDYRAHKRSALTHFQSQWTSRVADEMPSLDLIRDELSKAVKGSSSGFFELVTFNHYSTRWRAHYAGKTIIVAYNHRLKVPVSVWEEGIDYRVMEPTPVKMEDYRRGKDVKEETSGTATEVVNDVGANTEPADAN